MLQEEDLSTIATSAPPELPGAFALMATLVTTSPDALARGEFRLIVHGLNGPSGAMLLGRFCYGDAQLRRAVEAHLRAEEAARPDAIFAEIVHLPEGRLGNILCRPSMRTHEIVYLARSGVPEAQRIPITDLRVGLSRDRLVLYSERHRREVVPRLTSAHNYAEAALGIYRFLCAFQQEGLSARFGWTWGPFAGASFLQRVSSGRTVLSMARWNLERDQLLPLAKALAAERYRAVHRLRTELGLLRWVGLADGDNVLPIDLDNVLHARNVGALQGWFFIRYGDPQWHLRFRIHAERRWLSTMLVPALQRTAEPLLRDGCIWKIQLDTYEREVGRYGGAGGIELAEAIFEADSDAVLSIVQLLGAHGTADARWRLALRGMHLLLLDFGFDVAERLKILRQVRASFT